MARLYNRRPQMDKRRELRSRMPPAEALLWSRLKSRQLSGLKFRRQYSVGPYIIDFYCPEHKLAVEIDGESHSAEGAPRYDADRQAFIERSGMRVFRFANSDVYDNLEGVLATIAAAAGVEDI